MLTTIRETISKLPEMSFEEYYLQYISSVQDMNMELESQRLVSGSLFDIKYLDRLLKLTIEELKRI